MPDPNGLGRILVVGNGMVGHHFLEAAHERGLFDTHQIVVVGEEPRRAYDRVHLSSLFDGVEASALRSDPTSCTSIRT